jgi:uncharacterized protein YbbK (DUF523 family)
VSDKSTKIGDKPCLGVSQCLLGDPVRYDAACKVSSVVVNALGRIFELMPVCPEVEAGMNVPRPPVQLTGSIAQPRMTGRDNPGLDVTERIIEFAEQRLPALDHIHGFVFKSHSPSCGLNSTPVFIDGICVTASSRGLFARAVCQHYPDLPVIEDSELDSEQARQAFIDAVITRAQTKT